MGFPGKDFWKKLPFLKLRKKVPENVKSYAQQSRTWRAIEEYFSQSLSLRDVIPLKFESLKETGPFPEGKFPVQVWKFNWKPITQLTKILEYEEDSRPLVLHGPSVDTSENARRAFLNKINDNVKAKLKALSYTVAPELKFEKSKFSHHAATISGDGELLIFLPEAFDQSMGIIGTSGETWSSLIRTSKEFCIHDPDNLIPNTDPIWQGFARLSRG